MKTKINHLISVEPDLLLAQPNPSRTYECPNIDECLRVVPRPTSYTTELVVELATIGRVNISSDISIHHTVL